MQKRKNIVLLIAFSALLAWTLFYINLEPGKSGLSLDELKFTVEDTAAINKIAITGKEISNTISRENSFWTVNDKYVLDPSMRKVLFSVLHQVRVKRTLPKSDIPRISDELLKEGFTIRISMNEGPDHAFYAGGNGISLSYFMDEDNIPYVVHLPGYESYVTGIFEVKENDWRDRLIFQTSWMGIKSMEITYPENPENNVKLWADNNLYRIEGVAELDTAGLMNFLDEISIFYTDQYINPQQIPAYDSLRNTKPFAHLIVNALGMEEPVNIDFFARIPGENITLGILNRNQMCLFESRRIEKIFKRRDDFTTR